MIRHVLVNGSKFLSLHTGATRTLVPLESVLSVTQDVNVISVVTGRPARVSGYLDSFLLFGTGNVSGTLRTTEDCAVLRVYFKSREKATETFDDLFSLVPVKLSGSQRVTERTCSGV